MIFIKGETSYNYNNKMNKIIDNYDNNIFN